MRHAPGYRAEPRDTPVIDAIGSVVGVASLVIGTYALMFLAFAMHHGNTSAAVQNGLFLAVIAVANGLFEAVRHWVRHHG
jgi:hypothetical protein